MTNDIIYRKCDRLFKDRLPHYHRYRELMVYGFFGIGTFAVSMAAYAAFTEGFRWNVLVSNALSWIFSTLFAFLTNRAFVFLNRKGGAFAFWVQLIGFAGGRIITLIIEEIMLFVLVDQLDFPNMWIKLLTTVIVIFLNYVVSKLLVFRRISAAEGEGL